MFDPLNDDDEIIFCEAKLLTDWDEIRYEIEQIQFLMDKNISEMVTTQVDT